MEYIGNPTASNSTIHATSTHPTQDKLIKFRHMVHRLETIPFTQDNNAPP